MKFSENLKRIRTERSLSQYKLADKLGVNVRVIQRYESGEIVPKTEMAIKIADLFDTTVPELMGVEDSMEPSEKAQISTETLEALMYGGKLPASERKEIFARITDAYLKTIDDD